MPPEAGERPRPWWRAPMLSPQGFLNRAAAILVAFLGLHAWGSRESTTLLSGTPPGGPGALLSGGAYAIAYFATVVGVPILLLGAVLFVALARITSGTRSPPRA
jgi:hypothetical protein